jgi:glutathione S-transferase
MSRATAERANGGPERPRANTRPRCVATLPAREETTTRLYDSAISGNSYKVRLAAAQLGVPLAIVPVDILKGESRTPEFLAVNPNGRTPVLDDDGFVLAESNAILSYLARGTRLLPDDRKSFALVLQWMFFEQYSHEPYIATSRFLLLHRPDSPDRAAALSARRAGGWAALGVMERHLAANAFFVGGYTIADIALFAYTHLSHEGGFPLDVFPNVRAWLQRVRAQPGFIPIEQQHAGPA